MTPRGSSRIAVRGFSASMRASARRLNPIAALRAATIATRIQPAVVHVTAVCCAASSAPARANGSAKTEWLKRTKDPYVRSRFKGSKVLEFKVLEFKGSRVQRFSVLGSRVLGSKFLLSVRGSRRCSREPGTLNLEL